MCSVEFHEVFVVLFTRVVVFSPKSSFAHSSIIKVILAFLFHAPFVPVVIDLTSGFHKLSEGVNFGSVPDEFVLHEVLKPFLVAIYKSLLAPCHPSEVSLEVSSVSDC